MFSDTKINQDLSENDLNKILKRLYDTNFFELVSVELKNNILNISVKENPIIQNVVYNGVKSDDLLSKIIKDITLKSRSSYNEILLNKDKLIITQSLKNLSLFNNISL